VLESAPERPTRAVAEFLTASFIDDTRRCRLAMTRPKPVHRGVPARRGVYRRVGAHRCHSKIAIPRDERLRYYQQSRGSLSRPSKALQSPGTPGAFSITGGILLPFCYPIRRHAMQRAGMARSLVFRPVAQGQRAKNDARPHAPPRVHVQTTKRGDSQS
jgi:hypothetical protein